MIISLSQLKFSNANINHNFNKIIQNLEKFYQSDIIIFPELFLIGYLPADLLFQYKHTVNLKINELKSIIKKKKLTDKIFILGAPLYKDNKIYNSAFIFFNNKIYNYNKIFLPNYGVFDEKRYFHQGDNFIIIKVFNQKRLNKFKLKDFNIAVLICEDIWDDFSPVYFLKYKYNILVFIVINASPFEIDKQSKRLNILKTKANQTNSFFIYVNNLGLFDDVIFDGNSLVIDNKGNIINNLTPFKEEIFHFDLSYYLINSNHNYYNSKFSQSDLKKIFKNKTKDYLNFYKNFTTKFVDFEIKIDSNELKIKINNAYSINNRIKDSPNDDNYFNSNHLEDQKYEIIYNALVFSIREYFRNSGFNKAVIGLSGGIDSAVCLVLAKKAVDNVIPIIMPTKFNKQSSIDDAIKLCNNLNINYFIININDFYFNLRNILLKGFNFSDDFDLADENLQARIRAIILMYYANKNNALVVATSNKSEVSMGYFTLYGDSIGSIAPLKDLYKFQVYGLANYINKKYDNVIPIEIIQKEPSAELRENQKDEDDIPKYYVLDKVLYYHLEKKLDYNQIKNILKNQNIDLTKDLYLNIMNRIYKNEYKRYQTPLGFKISELSFTKERRVPILNSFTNDLLVN